MSWQVVLTADGSPTLAHPVHGETCHSRAGAWSEARERYAQACRLTELAREISERARTRGGRAVLRLLDVGTGLGLNLAAALQALEGSAVALEAVSLEHDTSVIWATLELFARPSVARSVEGPRSESSAELERWHAPVRRALAAALAPPVAGPAASRSLVFSDGSDPCNVSGRSVAMGSGSLHLLLGDARTTLAALPAHLSFDAVFLDLFSPGVEPESWDSSFLAEIARRMSPGSWLSTYTTSLCVRSVLRASGLEVGPGARVGTKASGTLAARGRALSPFDPRTTRRLERRAASLRGTFSDRIPSGPSVSGGALI